MYPHPLLRELGRQREQELRQLRGSLRRPYSVADDEDGLANVVLAARSGGEQAWRTLVNRFTPALRKTVRDYRLNAADTDDVVQTVWASAFSHIGNLRDPEAIGGWLHAIARREALHTIRRRQREILVDDETSLPHRSDDTAPVEVLLEAEQSEALHVAVDRLPDRQRILLGVLLSDTTTSYADVSRKLGVPVGAIGPTRERALARLRRDRQLTRVVSGWLPLTPDHPREEP
jgi:RNA polymerase sigma factor (sigma-70 family)